MLRSMIIGLAIACLLQVGAPAALPLPGVANVAHRIDWVQLQTKALSGLVCRGYTLLFR